MEEKISIELGNYIKIGDEVLAQFESSTDNVVYKCKVVEIFYEISIKEDVIKQNISYLAVRLIFDNGQLDNKVLFTKKFGKRPEDFIVVCSGDEYYC